MKEKSYTYWAKTTKDGQPGIEVLPHCRNVGFVAALLATAKKQQLVQFGFSVGETSLLAALHDIGKLSPGFQSKCEAWLEQYGLSQEAKNKGWLDDGLCERLHDKVSQFTAFNYFKSCGMSDMSADLYSAVIGAHHGRPHKIPNGRGLPNGRQIEGWEQERLAVAKQLTQCLGNPPTKGINRNDAALWWLAGLITISDWIGSDETFFDNSRNIEEAEGRECAQHAVQEIDFEKPELKENLSFSEIFKLGEGAEPNALQKSAFENITEPGVYAIEAPMGMGKTEAALWVAYNLIQTGKANGLYFALPTQITSNRIHLRVSDFVDHISCQAHRVGLVHANSWLMEVAYQPRPEKTSRVDKIDQDA
ncbi:MAG: CRISPR-associated endonuclease Cas3'', partial [Pseudomonadales bacterium]|nr:CRISPR-associated endonuclease Cas3'' [Pseudomonadales bacterium]